MINIIIGARIHEYEEYDSPMQIDNENKDTSATDKEGAIRISITGANGKMDKVKPEIVKPEEPESTPMQDVPVIVDAGHGDYKVQWIDQYGIEDGQCVRCSDAALAVAKVAQYAGIGRKVFCRLVSVKPLNKF